MKLLLQILYILKYQKCTYLYKLHEASLWHGRTHVQTDGGCEPNKARNLEPLLFSKTCLPTPSCPAFTNMFYHEFFFPMLCHIYMDFYLILFKKYIFKNYLNQTEKIKISHGLRLSENIKLCKTQTSGFSDLKLSIKPFPSALIQSYLYPILIH